MFTRVETLNLKPGRLNDFKEALDKQVLPMLRKQDGFKDAFAFVGPSGTEIRLISFWADKEKAERHDGTAYPDALKAHADFFEGTPRVRTYEVLSSTFQKLPSLTTV